MSRNDINEILPKAVLRHVRTHLGTAVFGLIFTTSSSSVENSQNNNSNNNDTIYTIPVTHGAVPSIPMVHLSCRTVPLEHRLLAVYGVNETPNSTPDPALLTAAEKAFAYRKKLEQQKSSSSPSSTLSFSKQVFYHLKTERLVEQQDNIFEVYERSDSSNKKWESVESCGHLEIENIPSSEDIQDVIDCMTEPSLSLMN